MSSREKLMSSREKLLTNAVALKTMETHAALTAKAITSNTESKITRANYEHYQSHYKVCVIESEFIGLVTLLLQR